MIKPLFNAVVVTLDPPSNDAGPIKLARTERSITGEVYAVGDECKVVKPGDRVLVTPKSGTEHDLDGVKRLAILENLILVIL